MRALCLLAVIGSFGVAAPTASPAAAVADPGITFLQAQLPGTTALSQATYEQLTRADGLATAAHRRDAVSILTAALTRQTKGHSRDDEERPPCVWVAHLLHASVAAAPEMASRLMEAAASLCPDCADEMQTAAELFNDKNVVDGKTVVDDKNGPAASVPMVVSKNDPSQTDGLNLDDPETRNVGLYVGGYGPGFPGVPGFVGSPPGGNIALPSPILNPVTPVMNN